MAITVTLDKIKEKFDEWHNGSSNYDKIHKATNDRLAAVESNTSENDENINVINKQLIKLINGSASSSNNEVDSAYSNNGSVNFKTLKDDISIIKKQLGITNASTTVSDLITNMIAPLKEQVNQIDTNPSHHYHEYIMQQEISTGADLNNYTRSGIYRCTDASYMQQMTNHPVDVKYTPFYLIVLSGYDWDDTNYTATEDDYIVRQIFLGAYGDNTYGDVIFTRNYFKATGTWSEWSELYGTHNTERTQMSVEFSSGATKNYILLTQKG